MTNRERIINTVLGKETDRAPFVFPLGFWDETLDRWRAEGVEDGHWDDGLNFDSGMRGITSPYEPGVAVNIGLEPWFPYEEYEHDDRKIRYRNMYGGINERMIGSDSLERQITYPVTCMEDWEKLKERLDPEDPRRFPENFDELAKQWNESDQLIMVGDYPYGLIGTCRELMGVEELLVSFYTQPELVKDMMDYLTDFWITIYEKIAKKVKIDCVHIWEDMSGQTGSLISPAFVREFMGPNYKKLKDFCVRHDIPLMSVDTDGDVRDLIEPFMEAGVNLMYPFEVIRACTTLDYRKKYPTLGMLGGIDKMEIAKGKEAIDKLMDTVKELLACGRYIPAPDHAIPPEVSHEDYVYFVRRMRETILEAAKK